MNKLDVCNYEDSTKVTFINLGPDSTGITDQIIISFPSGISVDTNFSEGINHFDGRLIVDVTHSEGNGKIGRMTKQCCRNCHRIEGGTISVIPLGSVHK